MIQSRRPWLLALAMAFAVTTVRAQTPADKAKAAETQPVLVDSILTGPATPIDLPSALRLAGVAFEAVSCQGFARVDFFYTREGTVLVNEINTIPGMTATSYFPKMWEATGLPLPQLLDRMISTALRRRPGFH